MAPDRDLRLKSAPAACVRVARSLLAGFALVLAIPALVTSGLAQAPAGDGAAASTLMQGLPDVERARLEYLFEAEALLARTWPWLPEVDTCLLLYAPEREWVVNCDDAPAGFVRIPGSFRGRAVHTRSGGRYRHAGRDLTTSELLALLPAAAHVDVPNERGSDLPAAHAWLLLGTLEGLRAHHPAFREASTDEWLSVALHELFHVRQLRAGHFAESLARINSRELTPERLDALFERERTYRAKVVREYRLLVAEAANPRPSAAGARRALASWQRSYRARRTALLAQPDGPTLAEADALFTYVEGLARYVESVFLIDPAQRPERAIPRDPRFHAFERFAAGVYSATNNRQLDRQYYYAIGFHLALLLDRVAPDWKRCVQAEPELLIGMCSRVLAAPANTPAC